nr:MAG TPA: hypothetical protein [Caudoviricetes sp.]
MSGVVVDAAGCAPPRTIECGSGRFYIGVHAWVCAGCVTYIKGGACVCATSTSV